MHNDCRTVGMRLDCLRGVLLAVMDAPGLMPLAHMFVTTWEASLVVTKMAIQSVIRGRDTMQRTMGKRGG